MTLTSQKYHQLTSYQRNQIPHYSLDWINQPSTFKAYPNSRLIPLTQKRWCGAAGVDKVITLSDHLSGSFGEAYGVLIKGLRLLARAVFVLDRDGIIQYVQLVKEVADEPDYKEVLEALKNLV